MGRVVVTEFASLDGVMEAPGGEPGYAHTGWVARHPDQGQFAYKLEEIKAAEVHLLGRVTYESFAGAWPSRDDPEGFAAKINAMPKWVVSSTLREPLAWNNSHLLQGELAAAVRSLAARVEGDILVAGSCTLVHALLEADLVDELRLMVFPLVLGSGRRVFPERPDATRLTLAEQRTYGDVALLVYRAARETE